MPPKEQVEAFDSALKNFKDPEAITDEALKKFVPEAAPKKEKKAKKADDKPAPTSTTPAAASVPATGTYSIPYTINNETIQRLHHLEPTQTSPSPYQSSQRARALQWAI